MDHTDVVVAVKAQLLALGQDLAGPCGAFKITCRVAWQLRGEGWGLIHSGGNGCETRGDKFRADTIMQRDGTVIDILNRSESNEGDTSDPAAYNIPTWSPTGPQSPFNFREPFDPGDSPIPTPVPVPVPTPTPAPGPDVAELARRVEGLEEQVKNLTVKNVALAERVSMIEKRIPIGVTVKAEIPKGIPLIGGRSFGLAAALVLPS